MSAGAAAVADPAFEVRVKREIDLAKAGPKKLNCVTQLVIVVALTIFLAGIVLFSLMGSTPLSIGLTVSGGGILIALWIIHKVMPKLPLSPERKEAMLRACVHLNLLVIRYTHPEQPLPDSYQNQSLGAACNEAQNYSLAFGTFFEDERAAAEDFQQEVARRLAAQIGIPFDNMQSLQTESKEIADKYAEQESALNNQAHVQLLAQGVAHHAIALEVQVNKALEIFHQEKQTK